MSDELPPTDPREMFQHLPFPFKDRPISAPAWCRCTNDSHQREGACAVGNSYRRQLMAGRRRDQRPKPAWRRRRLPYAPRASNGSVARWVGWPAAGPHRHARRTWTPMVHHQAWVARRAL